MATTIQQKPLYDTLPVGQQVVFTAFNSSAVENFFNVKYIAEVHIGTTPINLSTSDDLVATFKTTPNNTGRGIFDFRPLLESYVSPDNTGSILQAESSSVSRYKGIPYTLNTPHPIHLIDKYARSENAIRYFAIKFSVEGSALETAPVLIISNSEKNSVQYTFFNGVLQYDDYLTLAEETDAGALVAGNNYGYNLSANLFYPGSSVSNSKFLTNAPTTQYANIDDYGTLAFLMFLPSSTDRMEYVRLKYYNSSGVQLGTHEDIGSTSPNGGATTPHNLTTRLLYFGAFPANLRGNGTTTFAGLVAAGTIQGGYYTITPRGVSGFQQEYRINLNCPTLKGYEPIRLTWLNQWGVWDYYTFTQKSVRSLSTNRTTYTQAQGTWNDEIYRIDGFKGGKKNFRVNSTERIQVNSDFVSEADGRWFEELVNSPEVYIINGYDSNESAPHNTITNKYVEPVLITTSSYIRKTVANDKLMQYSFEMERNRTQTTQTS